MIRVLLAEDMHMIRAALTALLHLESDLEVVAEVTRGDEIVPAALRVRPDVAIVDIDLPVLDGISAAAQLRKMLPTCRILVLTAMGQPGQVRRALSAGIEAFLRETARGASTEEIAARLHLSAGTVRNYLTGAITKTGARNKIDAIRIAEDAGWL
ncbi:DNA-binding response regulator [Microbispora rosea]|uniref:response regulator transcription factor n=1 Tax=Microbispora rosea TaxID=58117 RepID=UPI00344352A9